MVFLLANLSVAMQDLRAGLTTRP